MIENLSDCLENFHHLVDIRYFYEEEWIPARFRWVLNRIWGRDLRHMQVGYYPESLYGAVIGLQVLLEVVVLAGKLLMYVLHM